jgi:hypothetical protein
MGTNRYDYSAAAPSVRQLIAAQQRPDGQISDGVYVAMQWRHNYADMIASLIRVWIGSAHAGPILEYDAPVDRRLWWDGAVERTLPAGGWSPCYSHGNYGRNYACGGTWSIQTNNLLDPLRVPEDKHFGLLKLPSGLYPVPDGVPADISVTDMDVSGGWVIWYEHAADAIDNRLSPADIARAALPKRTKQHLLLCPAAEIAAVREVISIFEL